jgi:hypothetical protein
MAGLAARGRPYPMPSNLVPLTRLSARLSHRPLPKERRLSKELEAVIARVKALSARSLLMGSRHPA